MKNLKRLHELYTKYNSICNFIVIYIQEAHSNEEWNLESNQKKGIDISQHRKIKDKINACKELIDIWKDEVDGIEEAIELGKFKIVCDDIDCNAETKFNALPERIFILNKNNTIAVKGGYGPDDFDINIIDRFLSRK